MRLARLVKLNETVVNMFAGVGCFSVLMARHGGAQRVYSIDVNPFAVEFMRENVRLNRVDGQVVPILGDAKEVVGKRLLNVADRVVMPLPERAYEYLDYAVVALKQTGGWVHYYGFEHASREESPVGKVVARVSGKLQKLGVESAVSFGRVVRSTGPDWFLVVVDVHVLGS